MVGIVKGRRFDKAVGCWEHLLPRSPNTWGGDKSTFLFVVLNPALLLPIALLGICRFFEDLLERQN